MRRFITGLVAFAVGAGLAYMVVQSNRPTPTHPSEDPANAIVEPSKVYPITPEMEKALESLDGKAAYSGDFLKADKKAVTLKAFAGKPVLLHFIQKDCPCCIEAQPAIDILRQVFGEKIKVLGVIDASPEETAKWVASNKPKFDVVSDPNLEAIRYYNAERGTYMTILDSDGKVAKSYAGYSQEIVSDVAERLSRMASTKKPAVDVSRFPERPTSGCPFPEEVAP